MGRFRRWMDDRGVQHSTQPDGREGSSGIRIVRENPPSLRYPDSELYLMTRNCAGDVVQHVSGFRYWTLGEARKMSRPENICGYQQRAFDFYWSILIGVQTGGTLLGLGTSECIAPATFGTDKYYGSTVPPNQTTYLEMGFPHMKLDADSCPFPFFAGKFAGVALNHVIEHLTDPMKTLRECVRITRDGGVIFVITPDLTFNEVGHIDPTHTHEYWADEFYQAVTGLQVTGRVLRVIEHNTFDNDFSFNTVIEVSS